MLGQIRLSIRSGSARTRVDSYTAFKCWIKPTLLASIFLGLTPYEVGSQTLGPNGTGRKVDRIDVSPHVLKPGLNDWITKRGVVPKISGIPQYKSPNFFRSPGIARRSPSIKLNGTAMPLIADVKSGFVIFRTDNRQININLKVLHYILRHVYRYCVSGRCETDGKVKGLVFGANGGIFTCAVGGCPTNGTVVNLPRKRLGLGSVTGIAQRGLSLSEQCRSRPLLTKKEKKICLCAEKVGESLSCLSTLLP